MPITLTDKKNSFALILPSFQGIVTWEGDIHSFQKHIDDMISEGKITINPDDDVTFVIYVSREAHFSYTIMTKDRFEKYKTQQEIMAGMHSAQRVM